MVSALEAIIEVIVLAVLVWPIVRLLLAPAFIGRLGGSPELAIAIGVGLGAYVAAIAVMAILVPWLLRPAALGAAVALLVLWWRARPGFGRGRGLPPGSLALAPVGPWVDDMFYRKQADRYGTVFKTTHVVMPTVCIVGLPAGMGLLREHDAVLDTPPARFSRFVDGGFVRYMSPDDHATYWQVMRRGVSGSIIRDAESDLARIIRQSLGQATSTHAMTDAIAFRVLVRLLFGVAPDDPDMNRVAALAPVIDPRRAWRSTRRGIRAAIEETEAIILRRTPAGFYGASLAVADGSIDEGILLRNYVLLNHTAAADLGGLLAWIVRMLTDHPELIARVRAEEPPSTLARRITQETLRLEQSEFLTRRATADIHWAGFVIPKGWRVRICVRESHRSAELFADPDRFDPDRFLATRPSREAYSPFGVATTRTSCLGDSLSLTVGGMFVEELVRGFDWSVMSDGPTEFSGFHWRPSRKFRIALAAR